MWPDVLLMIFYDQNYCRRDLQDEYVIQFQSKLALCLWLTKSVQGQLAARSSRREGGGPKKNWLAEAQGVGASFHGAVFGLEEGVWGKLQGLSGRKGPGDRGGECRTRQKKSCRFIEFRKTRSPKIRKNKVNIKNHTIIIKNRPKDKAECVL